MSAKTRAELLSQCATLAAYNTTGDISDSDARTLLTALADSCVNIEDDDPESTSGAQAKANAAQAAAISAAAAAAPGLAPVQSVAGRTGTVTLVKGDVGLGNVDNTADTAKPVSTAQATADTAVATAAASDATTKANAAQAAAVQRSNHTGTQLMATISDAGGAATKNVGTSAGTVAAGDDSRLSNSRTPTAHASSHASGGSDPVSIASSQISDATTAGKAILVAATYAAIRTLLGLVIGTDVQAFNANLAAVAGLTSAADALAYFTGSGSAAVTTLTSFMRTLLDDTDAATARATLGLGTETGTGGMVRAAGATMSNPTFTGVVTGPAINAAIVATSRVLGSDFIIAAGYGMLVPGQLTISSGVKLTIAAGGILEIT